MAKIKASDCVVFRQSIRDFFDGFIVNAVACIKKMKTSYNLNYRTVFFVVVVYPPT